MTTIEIEEQIKIIQEAGKAASKSKESAIKFLTDAGILPLSDSKKVKAKQ